MEEAGGAFPNQSCALPHGEGERSGASLVSALVGWWLAMATCGLCTVLCFVFASIGSYRLHQLETAARSFDERVQELEERYLSQSPGTEGVTWHAARLSEAVERSVARAQLPTVREQPLPAAASQAGSDVSRVSELRGFDDRGEGWMATTERALHDDECSGAGVPTMTLMEFAGYRPPGTDICPAVASPPARWRPHASPPRRGWGNPC